MTNAFVVAAIPSAKVTREELAEFMQSCVGG
jgi:hypothetical protein